MYYNVKNKSIRFIKKAVWPSGKAVDCKSSIPSSNLGAACQNLKLLRFLNLERITIQFSIAKFLKSEKSIKKNIGLRKHIKKLSDIFLDFLEDIWYIVCKGMW